jgi:hypothetical protein
MKKIVAISDEPLAMHYRFAISNDAARNGKSLIANASFIANCQLLIKSKEF